MHSAPCANDARREWKNEVLTLATERFDRRLGEEIGALRHEMAREFATVRIETAKQFADMRVELAAKQVSLLKGSFVFWVGQLAASAAAIDRAAMTAPCSSCRRRDAG